MFDIDIYTIVLWITGILITSFDVVVFFGSKKLSSRVFAVFSFIVAVWSVSYGFLLASVESDVPFILIKVDHVLGMLTSLGFLYFSFVYPHDIRPHKRTVPILVMIGLIFVLLFFSSDLMISGMYQISKPDHWGWNIGKLYFLYILTFYILWITILANIFKHAKQYKNKTDKINQLFMFWGLTIGIIPPAVLNILLPAFGIYGMSWVGPIASAIWIYIIGYSIIRYRQMNVKAVAAEVLAIAMTVILFINIFVDISSDLWVSIATFVVFIILTFYLIKNILREAKQTELLKDLNDNLERKVMEQTIEIRKSYDLEKKARRELEKLNETKDQFIMITQHHLRTPVVGIRWQLESILSGAYGDVGEKVRTAIIDAGTAVARLTKIVDDFLAITALKVGGNILTLTKASLQPQLLDILQELHIDIENKKLQIDFPKEHHSWPELTIDVSKMREALLIVIENAVRYSNEGGRIIIETNITDDVFKLSVTDTGVGMTSEDKEKIFHHHFHRSDVARKMNPIGMGVGLSVARAILRAHHGDITLQSEGANRGVKVTMRVTVDGFIY